MSRLPVSIIAALGLSFALVACDSDSKGGDGADGADGIGEDGNADNGAEESGEGDGGNGDNAEGGAEDGAEGGGDDSTFLIEPDGAVGSIECDVWKQDCPSGEKCAPWDSSGSGVWDGTKCIPVNETAVQPGDQCQTEGAASGIDNCVLGAMCWGADEEGVGTCVAFCTGSEAEPDCENPTDICSIANDGVITICLPTCDPLLQDCGEGEGCYGIQEGFVCGPVAGEGQTTNAPCGAINDCSPGHFCVGSAGIPDCQAGGCCASFCELDNDMCSEGTECVPFYEEGMAPPNLDDVGICIIPM